MSAYIHQIYPLHDPECPFYINEENMSDNDTGVPMHWHEDFEILLTTSGIGELVVDGTTLFLPEGSVAIIHSCALHSSKTAEAAGAEGFAYILLEIQKSFLLQNQLDLDDIAFSPNDKDTELVRMIRAILQEAQQKGDFYKSMLRAKMLELIVYICRNYAKDNPCGDVREPNKLSVARSALFYIRHNFREPISIDQIGREIGTSKYYLCRIFKEVTGKTIVDYTNYMRCQYAKSLLQAGRHTVLEVLTQSGFHDPSYFSQVYKKHIGISPSREGYDN